MKTSKKYLSYAHFQIKKLSEYFRDNPADKVKLKIRFGKLYSKAKDLFPEDQDLQFQYILNSSFEDNRQVVQNAIFVIMALFFESCDIFEGPK